MTDEDWRNLAIALVALPYTLVTIALTWIARLGRR